MTQLKYRILKWLKNFKKYSTENSIHARPLRHRPFKHFFDENDAHDGDLIWHTEACQLTKCGSVLSNWPTVVKVSRQQLAYRCQSLSAATGLQLSKSVGSNSNNRTVHTQDQVHPHETKLQTMYHRKRTAINKTVNTVYGNNRFIVTIKRNTRTNGDVTMQCM